MWNTSLWVPRQGSPSRFPWDTSPRAYRGESFLFRAEEPLIGLFSRPRRSRLGKSSNLSPVLSSSHDGEIPWSEWLGRFFPVRVSLCASLPGLASESLDSAVNTIYGLFPLLDGAATLGRQEDLCRNLLPRKGQFTPPSTLGWFSGPSLP